MTAKSGSTCGNWKAWHDNQPSGPKTLHVTGQCTFPTGGYSVQLKPREPQGINPRIYLMDRIVTSPTGKSNQMVTPVDVQYSEKTDAIYTEVQIFPDDVHIPVKEIQ